MRRLCVALLLLTACQPDLVVPGDAVITCASEDDCPEGFLCDGFAGVCVRRISRQNSPPQVVLEPVSRQLDTVAFGVTVFDNDDTEVTLSVEYDDGTGFQPATISPAQVDASAAGEPHEITWAAASDLGNPGYLAGLRLRITTADDTDSGEAVESDLFDFGNDAPVLTDVSVEVSADGVASGNVVVRFTVQDSARDPVAVSGFAITYDGSFTDLPPIISSRAEAEAAAGAGGAIPSGAVVDLATSETGVAHSFTWSSSLTAIVDEPWVQVQLRVADFAASSDPAASPAFHLRNQTPPRIAGLRVPAADFRRATGPTPIYYQLIDDHGDLAAVSFEYSLDYGVSFLPCVEYQQPESEGQTGLSTAGGLGVGHVFVWDASGVSWLPDLDVVVRATPSQAGFVGAPALLSFGNGAGPPRETPYSFLTEYQDVNSLSAGTIAVADFDGDGRLDLAVAVSTIAYVQSGNVSCETACFAASPVGFTPPPSGTIVDMAARDLDADGYADLVTARTGTPSRVTVRFSNGGSGLSANYTNYLLSEGTIVGVDVGDVDGDGTLDLVAATSDTGGAVFFGLGSRGFSSPATVSAGTGLIDLQLAHINNDDQMDGFALTAAGDQVVALLATGVRANPFTRVATSISTLADSLMVADFNSDGVDDVMLASVDPVARLRLAATNGSLADPLLIGTASETLTSVAVGDVNGDARPDLLWGQENYLSGAVYVRFNTGLGDDGLVGFAPALSLFAIPNPDPLRVVDVNLDGIGDVLGVKTYTGSGVGLSLMATASGIGQGIFSTPEQYWAGNSLYVEYALADFDGDGLLDFVYLDHYLDDDLMDLWWSEGERGLGTGRLDGPYPLARGSLSDLRAGDFNHDGFGDVWFTDEDTATSYLRLGQGDGTFSNPVAMSSPPFPWLQPYDWGEFVPTVDLDGNGILDCFYGSDGSTDLEVRPAPATNGLPDPPPNCDATATATFPVLNFYGSTVFRNDINRDGLADLAASSTRYTYDYYVLIGQNEALVEKRTVTLAPFSAVLPETGQSGASFIGAPDDFSVDLPDGGTAPALINLHTARIALGEPLANYQADLEDQGLVPSGALYLTYAYQALGDRRLAAVPDDPEALTYRVAVQNRLGARLPDATDRAGLSLANEATATGVVLDLPIVPAHTNRFVTSGDVYVMLRSIEYVRAAEESTDSLYQTSEGEGVLPRLEHGAPWIRREATWRKIRPDTDGDLTTGTGPRYVIVIDGDQRFVRVLLDRLGLVQAFII